MTGKVETNHIVNMVPAPNLVPPDGKYGWVIVLSYAIANVSTILK